MGLRNDLIEARNLINTPEKWGQGDGYRGPKEPQLCVISSCTTSTKQGWLRATEALEASLGGSWGYDDGLRLARFNDNPATTHADIMALFDRAINAAPVDFTGLDAALDELRKPVDEVRE